MKKYKYKAGGNATPGISGNGKYFPYYTPTGEWQTPDMDVRKTLGPVPEHLADLEAEGGETMYVPDQGGLPAQYNIEGPRHSEGGVPLIAPPDSFVFSDTRSMKLGGEILTHFGKSTSKKFTPADLAKQYNLNKFRKQLEDPDSDPIQKHTAEMMIANFNSKLGALALVQEAKKGFEEGIPSIAVPYLASAQIEPQDVLPFGTQATDISYEDVTMQYGGNSWQNGPQGTGYEYGGELPKAQTGLTWEEFKAAQEAEKEKRYLQMKNRLSGPGSPYYNPQSTITSPTMYIGPGFEQPAQATEPITAPLTVDFTKDTPQPVKAKKPSVKSSNKATGISSWKGDRTFKGNASKYTDAQWQEFANKYCPTCKTNKELQKFIKTSPEFAVQIAKLHAPPSEGGFGMPLAGIDEDGKLGHRWDFVFDKPEVQQVAKAADPKAAEIQDIQRAKNPNYNQASGAAPWWLQDVVRTAGAAGDFMRLKKYLPWAPKISPYVPDPTFYDPTRELAANAEQANIQTQGANAFGDPQQFSARSSGVQGQAAKNATDILGKYNNLNVGVSNQAGAQAAGIYNQANEFNAKTTQDLYDKTVLANQNFDNAKNMARQNLRQSYIDAVTNRGQAQVLNSLYPNYQIDPSTGGMMYFSHGDNISPSNPQSSFDERVKSGLALGLKDDAAVRYALGPEQEQYLDARGEYLKNQRFPRTKGTNIGY